MYYSRHMRTKIAAFLACLYIFVSFLSGNLHRHQHTGGKLCVSISKYEKTYSHDVFSHSKDCLVCHYNVYTHYDLPQKFTFETINLHIYDDLFDEVRISIFGKSYQNPFLRGPPEYFS